MSAEKIAIFREKSDCVSQPSDRDRVEVVFYVCFRFATFFGEDNITTTLVKTELCGTASVAEPEPVLRGTTFKPSAPFYFTKTEFQQPISPTYAKVCCRRRSRPQRAAAWNLLD